MDLLAAALLGVVQGLTEFLPVSSTAHLLLAERCLGFDDPGGAFTVMIQLGAVLAVVWLYRRKVWSVVSGLPHSAEARRFALVVLTAVAAGPGGRRAVLRLREAGALLQPASSSAWPSWPAAW